MTDQNLPLAGKIALVTGASRGIGRASALALAKAGAHVIAVARTTGGLEELDDEIRAATGQPATLVPMDISQVEGLDQLGLAIHERHGRLDILVHAAAILGAITPVSHIEPALWDKVMATNLTATYRLIRTTERLLRASEAGRAIFLTTGRVQRPKASTASPRRPWSTWCRPGPTSWRTPPSAPPWWTRASCAPRCAPRPCRARIP